MPPAEPAAAITGLPIEVSGTKSLFGAWWVLGEQPAGQRLTASAYGLLTGQLTNPLDCELTDCMVLYENWMYPVSGTLSPGEAVTFDGVSPRNLEWHLSRRRVVDSKDVGTPWDQASADVPRILEMMMFYQAAGGAAYTGLTHRYQPGLDLSEHLRTGRAILVGRSATAGSRLGPERANWEPSRVRPVGLLPRGVSRGPIRKGGCSVIETHDLTKKYGELFAIRSIELKLDEGDLFGFIGPNGAGKTTTMRIIATLLNPTWGEAYVCGNSIYTKPKEIRRLVGYMPDFFGVYDDMRVIEYLEFFAAAYRIRGERRRQLCNEMLEIVDLDFKRDAYANTLSRGQTQRLGLARTLLHDPQVLLLDEPLSGLDPRARIEMRNLLRRLGQMGKTIIVSSHILPELADICNKIGIIDRGVLGVNASVADVMKQVRQRTVLHVAVKENPEAAARLAGAARAGGSSDHGRSPHRRDAEARRRRLQRTPVLADPARPQTDPVPRRGCQPGIGLHGPDQRHGSKT